MMTAYQEAALIEDLKSLSEMELTAVFEGIADHVWRNGLSDAVRISLDVEDLRSEVNRLEEEIEDVREDKYDLKSKCSKAVGALEDLEETLENIKMADLQKEVKRIIEMLSEE